MSDSAEITGLVESLASEDSSTRIKAREELVKRGDHEVVRALVHELLDHRQHVRWEAAKALTAIADPSSVSALLNAIDDEDSDVRWVASEGVIALKAVGLKATIHGLIRRASYTDYCQSAHHILRELKHECPDVVAPVLDALDGPEPGVGAPVAAVKALEKLGR